MTFAEIYTGERPYNSMNLFQAMQRVINGTLRPSRPIRLPIDTAGNRLWELMTSCWAGDPSDRPPASEVYNLLSTL
ncbi:unnamed protein product [Rhizoctonia solani]|uniref:Serine-threonine/tyrosine-protein kinase catalytic domain-containing protein n=1 Tax=Rhizoctonia solani TaxID=456999 RepID=A0A8H3GR01_9AGAM|nr:unnamed protein product [Rhizoctonia solani]